MALFPTENEIRAILISSRRTLRAKQRLFVLVYSLFSPIFARMRFFSTFLVAVLTIVAAAEVFKFPLPNGFPNVTSGSAMQEIEHQAGGSLPVSAGGIESLPVQAWQALQALAFNEIFEVAFFTQLLQNVTVG